MVVKKRRTRKKTNGSLLGNRRVAEKDLDAEIDKILQAYPSLTAQEASSVRSGIWLTYQTSSSARILFDFNKKQKDTGEAIIKHGKAFLANIQKWAVRDRLDTDIVPAVQRAVAMAAAILEMPNRQVKRRGRMVRSDVKAAVFMLAAHCPASIGVTVSKQSKNDYKKSKFHRFCEQIFCIVGLPPQIPTSTLDDYIAAWKSAKAFSDLPNELFPVPKTTGDK